MAFDEHTRKINREILLVVLCKLLLLLANEGFKSVDINHRISIEDEVTELTHLCLCIGRAIFCAFDLFRKAMRLTKHTQVEKGAFTDLIVAIVEAFPKEEHDALGQVFTLVCKDRQGANSRSSDHSLLQIDAIVNESNVGGRIAGKGTFS